VVTARCGQFSPKKERGYPEPVWTLWRKEKFLLLPGNKLRIVKPVIKSAHAILVPMINKGGLKTILQGRDNQEENTFKFVVGGKSILQRRRGVSVYKIHAFHLTDVHTI
jgi:hypothetical protein